MFTKHLLEKDEFEDIELDNDLFNDSSCSDNQLPSYHLFSSDANSENSCNDDEIYVKKTTKRRKIRAGTFDKVERKGR